MVQAFYPTTVGAATRPTTEQVRQIIFSPGYIGATIIGSALATVISKYIVLKKAVPWKLTIFIALIYSLVFWGTGAASMFVSSAS